MARMPADHHRLHSFGAFQRFGQALLELGAVRLDLPFRQVLGHISGHFLHDMQGGDLRALVGEGPGDFQRLTHVAVMVEGHRNQNMLVHGASPFPNVSRKQGNDRGCGAAAP